MCTHARLKKPSISGIASLIKWVLSRDLKDELQFLRGRWVLRDYRQEEAWPTGRTGPVRASLACRGETQGQCRASLEIHTFLLLWSSQNFPRIITHRVDGALFMLIKPNSPLFQMLTTFRSTETSNSVSALSGRSFSQFLMVDKVELLLLIGLPSRLSWVGSW